MKFNYTTFKKFLDERGSNPAMKYFSHCLDSKQDNLREKLDVVSGLEKDYGIQGVSVTVKPGERLQTSESVDYVVDFICKSIGLARDKNIPLLV